LGESNAEIDLCQVLFGAKLNPQVAAKPHPHRGLWDYNRREEQKNWNDGTRQTARRTRNRAGDGWSCADSTGENELTAGATARGYCVSREEHHFLFSAGDFGAGECGAFHCALCGRTVEEVRYSSFAPTGARGLVYGAPPTACAVGCILSSLRSFMVTFFDRWR
jgi:hypothetical protein